MFEKFDIDDKNIFKVCVIATMSSGKSTFINSIIGEEIVPEKNEACTARTMAILDNDGVSVKKAHIIRKNGAKEIMEIDNREVLERVNNDEDVVDFLIETDIRSIKNTSRAFMLIDTPGVNNSADERHGERTEEFLMKMDMGVVVYLLNATQLATHDDSILLQLVSEHIKKKNGAVKIIFVINKIDALDEEAESIAGIVKIAKEYIQNHGIQNPIIYPLSALAAKSLRMALYRKSMTRRELRKLEDVYEHYQSQGNNMLDYALLDDLSEEIYEIGDTTVSAQQLRRAIDNTGITEIEKRLESFMNDIEKHFAPEVVIKSKLTENTAQKFQQRLEKIATIPLEYDWKNFKEINARLETIDFIQKNNRDLADIGSIVINLEMFDDLSIATSNITDLIANIEQIKENIFDVFKQGKYIQVNRTSGLYFCPEEDEHNHISVRNFYLMSEDGNVWQSIHFSYVTEVIEAGREFYIYNEYSTFIFKVSKENSFDIVALLDTKIPIRIVKVAGMNQVHPSFDDINVFVENCIAVEKAKQAEIENAEEQLRRTYKGIVFDSEKDKNDLIEFENTLQQYCMNLSEYSHEELWNKKGEVSKLPNIIFATYLTKLVSALEVQENIERNAFINRIEIADLKDLEKISNDLSKQHYGDATNSKINLSIDQRRLQCQRDNLEQLVNELTKLSRSELKGLSRKIGESGYNENLIKEYILKVDNQYDILEEKELYDLCDDIEQRDIEGLEVLESEIRNKKYQDKFTAKYFDMIFARIEFLHVKNLEEYCVSVKNVDRIVLQKIKDLVDKENCRAELKNKFYTAIKEREEQLDYEELCQLTGGIDGKSLQELSDLYRKLSDGSYNAKFIKAFLVKVRVRLELAQKEQVEEIIRGLSTMTKPQVMEAEKKIVQLAYTDRIVALAKEKIAERVYVLDLYELMSIENDFNGLDLSAIENLRGKIKQKNVSERSRVTYLRKLHERECVIAYEKVSQRACLAKQLLEQNGLSDAGIRIAIFAPDYMQLLGAYFAMGGEENYSNIPVFFFPECSLLTITKTDIYYKTVTGFLKTNLSEIRSFSVEKKLFTEVLVITFTNGNIVKLSGGINKKNSLSIVNFLTVLVQNLNNEALLSKYQPYCDAIYGLREEEFEIRNVPSSINEGYIADLLLNKYNELDGKFNQKAIKSVVSDNWSVVENKVRTRFGIVNEKRIILYYDKTFLGSAKEGIAFGFDFVHIKNANQELISIPYEDIYKITQELGNGIIETTTNNIFRLDLGDADDSRFISLLDEYARGIQLVKFLKIEIKTNQMGCFFQENISNGEFNSCPKCGITVKIGKKFCAQCGSRIEIEEQDVEYIFCSQCGNRMIKGKNFCSSCGAKVN